MKAHLSFSEHQSDHNLAYLALPNKYELTTKDMNPC